MKVNIVLCHDSRVNFMLTRFKSFQRVLKQRNIELGILEIQELNVRIIHNYVLFFPYVTYKKLDPEVFDALQNDNIISISHGDESLEPTTLWFSLCGIFDEYLVYNESIASNISLYYFNYKLLPEGFSNYHCSEINHTDNGKIIYVGAPFKGRVELIKILVDSGYEVDIFGPKSWLDSHFRLYYKGFLLNADYYRVISEYKIMLALTSGDVMFDCHPNAKLGDSLSAKVIALTELDERTVAEFSEELTSIIRFNSVNEFLDSVAYVYNLDISSRIKIIKNSLALANNTFINYEYAYGNLINHIAENIDNYKNSRKKLRHYNNNEWKLSFLLRILQLIGILKVNFQLMNRCFLEHEYLLGKKQSLQFPLAFVILSRYYCLGSISIIKVDIGIKSISFSFIFNRKKSLFLPDIKALWFKL
uniref:hypothetical protein n=1 Tax=Algoriphagus sp. TaxID=1872435 RepID=UPI004048AF2E